jgi:phage terminase small subunit
MSKLSMKQDFFCREYLIDFNATQAAIRAGYSPRTAQPIASRMLSNVMVQSRISELKKEREGRTQIASDRVLQQYCDIADFRVTDILYFDGKQCKYKPMEEWPKSALAAVSAIKQTVEIRKVGDEEIKIVKLEFKVDDRLRALDSMARHLGLFDNFQTAEQLVATANALKASLVN